MVRPGHIPVLSVQAKTLPEAWEKAMLAVYDSGIPVSTEYDKPGDPPSLDATLTVVVHDPMAEPRLHKNIPSGPVELESYRQEVVNGIHDHWINPAEGKWTYTYHQRLFAYYLERKPGGTWPDHIVWSFPVVDQVAYMLEKLTECYYTRRAQAITWMPTSDPPTNDPPCLQRLWARMLPDENGGFVLNLNTHWRSRDLYKAWFMNAFAFTDLQRHMAAALTELIHKPVSVGRYMDISDSLHIYGSDQDDRLLDEIRKMQTSFWTDRAMETSEMQFMFDEAAAHLAEDPDYYANGGK